MMMVSRLPRSDGVVFVIIHGLSDSFWKTRLLPDRSELLEKALFSGYRGPDGVPFVANVPTIDGTLTLRQFRKHFSIPSAAGVQYVFHSSRIFFIFRKFLLAL